MYRIYPIELEITDNTDISRPDEYHNLYLDLVDERRLYIYAKF